MHIIIVGCGKVGRTLAEQLQEEETDLTLIDTNADTIDDLTEDIDAMGIVGNGASINTLLEAGVNSADILIAVTASDELNLLCCLIAQKTGHCQTIARVRNPIYSKEIGFIKERLGISMIINPELTAAREISRLQLKLIHFPEVELNFLNLKFFLNLVWMVCPFPRLEINTNVTSCSVRLRAKTTCLFLVEII